MVVEIIIVAVTATRAVEVMQELSCKSRTINNFGLQIWSLNHEESESSCLFRMGEILLV